MNKDATVLSVFKIFFPLLSRNLHFYYINNLKLFKPADIVSNLRIRLIRKIINYFVKIDYKFPYISVIFKIAVANIIRKSNTFCTAYYDICKKDEAIMEKYYESRQTVRFVQIV